MARNLFGGTADSVAEDITGARVPNAVGTVWDGPSAGAANLTDLTDISGAPITQLQADANGFVAAFYGPDGYERLWVDFGGGRVALVSVTVGERLDSHISGIDPHGDRAYSDAQLNTNKALTTGVHGVTGTVVGTSDTQTLTNKTFSGGTLTGTIAGNPNFNGLPKFSQSVAGNDAFGINVTGDAFDRVRITTDGKMSWGTGLVGRDTTLYRSGSGVLKTDGSFASSGLNSSTTGASSALVAATTADGTTSTAVVSINPSSALKRALDIRLTGDSVSRLRVDQSSGNGSGTITFGDGTAADVSLFRDAASVLATNGLLRVYRANATDPAHSAIVTADTNARWYVQANGQMLWGPGNATQDTNLYRASANLLKTDSVFAALVETTTSGLSAATNFSVTSFSARRTAGVATLQVALSYSGSTITADSTGNIGDTLCATLPTGWRPAFTITEAFDRSGVAAGTVTILTDGTCTLKTLSPTSTIPSGGSVNFSATFVL